MKTIAALIAGLLLSAATFVAGIVIALVYLNVSDEQPRTQNLDTAALWTTEPASVEKQTLSFERLPARPVPKGREVASVSENVTEPAPRNTTTPDSQPVAEEPVADEPLPVVDPITTGAVDPAQTDTEPAPRAERNVAHVEWCSRRYRSYRAEDNSYRPYSGGRRACESPYSDVATADVGAEEVLDEAEPEARQVSDNAEPIEDDGAFEQVIYEDAPDGALSGDHIQSCMDRYRSYRPEDNTYQPFDGGPRRQCE